MSPFIYLDNAATTAVRPEVLSKMLPFFCDRAGNPSSIHAAGREARKAVENARRQVAAALHAEAREIYFTAGGSESDNWAIRCAAAETGKKHVITSAVEHHAVLHSCRALERDGFRVTYLPVDENGLVSPDDVRRALTDDTALISIMTANNEVGTLEPIREIGRIAREAGVLFHTDAVQGFLKVPFSAKTLGADLISVSSHKIHGPKGCGTLYISPRLKSFPALLQGGGQEGGYRSGTEATPAIFGFAAACTALSATFNADAAREKALLSHAVSQLSKLDGLVVNGAHDAPHILSLSVPGVPTQNTINILQDHGICVSAGSACAKGHRSHVLEAMGLPPEIMDGSFRVSLCRDTTAEELDTLVSVIREEIIPRAR